LRNGNEDIYVINDNGTGLVQLTDSPQIDENPQWSPDGSKILYISHEWKYLNPRYELWVVNVDGTNRHRLSDNIHLDSTPSWSPDGSNILYVAKNHTRTIMLAPCDGSDQLALTSPDIDGIYPIWSPASSKIACVLTDSSGVGLWVMNANGQERARVHQYKGKYKHLAWSPDGSQLGFVYIDPAIIGGSGKKEGIYVVSSDGSKPNWLAEGDHIKWCPDGKSIAFTSFQLHDLLSEDVYYMTYLIHVTSKSKPQIIYQTDKNRVIPVWSPDGLKITYCFNSTVYLKQSGKADVIRLRIPFAMGQPAWSTDSNRIVCQGIAGLGKKPSLFVVDIRDGEVFQLTENTNDLEAVWAPDSK
jgi:Tol biopolymer transport system component